MKMIHLILSERGVISLDRRFYERIPRYIDCSVVNREMGNEYRGILCDISEGGVGISLLGSCLPNLGSICTIQFVDELDRVYIITEDIIITNVSKTIGGVRIGASFRGYPSNNCISYLRLLCACQMSGSLSFAI